jgi:hypothetical protein
MSWFEKWEPRRPDLKRIALAVADGQCVAVKMPTLLYAAAAYGRFLEAVGIKPEAPPATGFVRVHSTGVAA